MDLLCPEFMVVEPDALQNFLEPNYTHCPPHEFGVRSGSDVTFDYLLAHVLEDHVLAHKVDFPKFLWRLNILLFLYFRGLLP